MPRRKTERVVRLPLSMIDEPAGVIRLEIRQEEVDELARSIEAIGLQIPISVRPKGSRYEIVFGHRRYLAHKKLEWKEIPCFVRELSDVDCAVARATENLGRVDLSSIEEAATYADLRDTHKLTTDQIGKLMGKSPGVVKRRLDLLRMPPELQKAVHLGQISNGVAEELVRLRDPERIGYYLGYAVDHGITVQVARQWVNDELKRQRLEGRDVGGGGGVASPLETEPCYFPCNICRGPVELGKDTVLRCCPGCVELIQKALSSGAAS